MQPFIDPTHWAEALAFAGKRAEPSVPPWALVAEAPYLPEAAKLLALAQAPCPAVSCPEAA